MNEYVLISTKETCRFFFKYNLNGILISFKCNEQTTDAQLIWMLKKLPVSEEELKFLNKSASTFNIHQLPPKISFEYFWDTYKYKVGSKPKAELIWKKMSIEDKKLAITHIKKYQAQIRLTGAAQAYPTTYLNQRYFES